MWFLTKVELTPSIRTYLTPFIQDTLEDGISFVRLPGFPLVRWSGFLTPGPPGTTQRTLGRRGTVQKTLSGTQRFYSHTTIPNPKSVLS